MKPAAVARGWSGWWCACDRLLGIAPAAALAAAQGCSAGVLRTVIRCTWLHNRGQVFIAALALAYARII